MNPERRPLFLEVIDHEEYVDLMLQYDSSGKIVGGVPIEGTRTAFVHLQGPNGVPIRAEIPHDRLDGLLALLFPEMSWIDR